ncbi:hypothetical protein GE09DRAFT_1160538 [Coniochaeta sp. 2T2.1]|nr:hypothetical protein GE09DRAFT_1160538 [Coniochaeta sp. 2T2.1]
MVLPGHNRHGTTATSMPGIAKLDSTKSDYYKDFSLESLARHAGINAPGEDEDIHVHTSETPNFDPDDDAFDAAEASTITEPAMTNRSGQPGVTIQKEADDSFQETYLWERQVDGKGVRLYLNGMGSESGLTRIVYRIIDADTNHTHFRALGHGRVSLATRGIVILESCFTNYKLLIEAFHLLRARKTELAREWQVQHLDKAHLINRHPYEWQDEEVRPHRYEVKLWDKLATIERDSKGKLLQRSYVYRRLVLRRALPHRLWETPTYVYTSVVSGKVVRHKSDDLIIPETEEAYALLACFFSKQTSEEWQDSKRQMSASPPLLGISRRNRVLPAAPPAVGISDENEPPSQSAKRGRDDEEDEEMVEDDESHDVKRAKSVGSPHVQGSRATQKRAALRYRAREIRKTREMGMDMD